MVARGAAAALALPLPEPDHPDVGPPARARRSRRGAGGGIAKRVSPHTCGTASPLTWSSRHPRDPGSARPRQAGDDRALPPASPSTRAGKFSEKPAIFAEIIEDYFPNVPKIELNRSGKARPGWDAWGAEAED
jgi:hypothetical protein